jgi:hypothetical protein
VPSGTITFSRGAVAGTIIGTATIDSSGHATLTVSDLPVGQRYIFASFSGDANFLSCSTLNPVVLTVS